MDPKLFAEIIDRAGEPPDGTDTDEGASALWRTWLNATAELQALGVSQRSMCDAAAQVTEARTEYARH